MNTHLSQQEIIDALGGVLDPLRLDHARACEACRREMSALESLTQDLAAVRVPEPSPLFWDHFSSRVQAATIAEGESEALPWWRGAWRPLVMLSATAAAVVLVVVWRPQPGPIGTRAALVPVSVEPVDSIADTSLALMQAAVDEPLSWDAARFSNLTPPAVVVDAAIQNLTPAQTAELIRLIRAEMRSGVE